MEFDFGTMNPHQRERLELLAHAARNVIAQWVAAALHGRETQNPLNGECLPGIRKEMSAAISDCRSLGTNEMVEHIKEKIDSLFADWEPIRAQLNDNALFTIQEEVSQFFRKASAT